MPPVAQWDNIAKTVIRITYPEKWTWEEFYELNTETIPAMLREVTHGVYLVADFSTTKFLPPNALTHGRSVMTHYPPNWNLLIVVTKSRFIQRLSEAFKHAYYRNLGTKVFTALNFEEAGAIIRKHEAGTPKAET
jgi:hypothetical protein